ncbi:hypothetical protein B9W64_37580 [Streptomyces sp. CS159]|uniref:hypothetical protein n=1 Tax=Streptomyces sp. CS159 TaxID=1982762 RepID=UPI000B40822C|nr:hypothetical protein [Streptomyces sp. CS159]OVZ99508.1 hypothetical protein B9W64_37580 [Streptomyces sp. CS159]
MIQHAHDRKIRTALAAFPVPNPLTVDSLFAVMRERYPRPLELWRGPSPLPGLHANALWLTRPDADSDVVWLDPAQTGAAAVHSLSHENGHIELGHKPLEMPTEPRPAESETYELLHPDFLAGCLFGRARSHEGLQDPAYQRIEDEAERYAFTLRRFAAEQARDTRHHDPLVDRLHQSL